MSKIHPNGYWVQKLTDDNVRDLLDLVVSTKKTKKFKKVLKQTKTEDTISILYCSTKINCYLSYAEDNLTINDYKISGQHPYTLYYEFMINLFGEEYANDFLAYANAYIEEQPDDKWAIRLKKIKDAIPAIVDSYNHNETNEI
ncbi:MAG: hypothetical protein IKY10_05345 [Clostridia bacterium]|nr:hypothetical protein [Clostridia bacterium]